MVLALGTLGVVHYLEGKSGLGEIEMLNLVNMAAKVGFKLVHP